MAGAGAEVVVSVDGDGNVNLAVDESVERVKTSLTLCRAGHGC
jgi:hypothetical protein